MHLIRSTTLVFTLLLTISIIQGKPVHLSSSNNIKDHIKYLLHILGIENEYTRFLSFMKIFPPQDNIRMTALYEELFSHNSYISDMIQTYAKYYSLEEIKELIQFYSSPVGHKSITMNNEINKHMEDVMLTKISDYIFTASEYGIHISLPEI